MKLDFRKLTITSIIFSFFLIPVHEFGHVICDWITGHPAAMSYARDYLLSGGNTPFPGLLGGPLLPLIISAVAVVYVYKQVNISVFYPIAIIGTLDRLILYLAGILPSDERSLSGMIGWNMYAFKYIFLSAEIILLLLVIISLFKYKIGIKQVILVIVIPVISTVAGAAIGFLVVERFIFPIQFKIQFG
jgi:hypothetical protein